MSRQRRTEKKGMQAVTLLATVACLAMAGSAVAQEASQEFTVDPKTSLAWWQVNPHLNHLWASTCPEDPSWQPGEGRSFGWFLDYALRPEDLTGYAATLDDRIPLYPRKRVRSLCTPAVRGEITVENTDTWEGAKGWISVDPEALITGLNMRDAYARKAIYETSRYPEVRFELDRVMNVREEDGKFKGVAVGTLTLRGVEDELAVPVEAWWEDPGTLRVTGQWGIEADDLVDRYGVSKFALGLGVGSNVWHTLHMGFDVILRPEGQ